MEEAGVVEGWWLQRDLNPINLGGESERASLFLLPHPFCPLAKCLTQTLSVADETVVSECDRAVCVKEKLPLCESRLNKSRLEKSERPKTEKQPEGECGGYWFLDLGSVELWRPLGETIHLLFYLLCIHLWHLTHR